MRTSILLLLPFAVVACNPAEDGPTKCENNVTPHLAAGPDGGPVPVPDGGVIPQDQCAALCGEKIECGSEFSNGTGPYITCLQDAGSNCTP